MYQPSSPIWWFKNHRYLIYFVRECTGVVIAGYFMYFLIASFFFPSMQALQASLWYRGLTWIAFAAAVFHSLTWFWVSVQVTPVPLKKSAQLVGFVALVAFWIGLSYLILNYPIPFITDDPLYSTYQLPSTPLPTYE